MSGHSVVTHTDTVKPYSKEHNCYRDSVKTSVEPSLCHGTVLLVWGHEQVLVVGCHRQVSLSAVKAR